MKLEIDNPATLNYTIKNIWWIHDVLIGNNTRQYNTNVVWSNKLVILKR